MKKTKDFASLRRIILERGIFCDDSQSYEKRKAGMEGFYAIKNLLNWVSKSMEGIRNVLR